MVFQTYDVFVGEDGLAHWPEGELLANGNQLQYAPGTWLTLAGEYERRRGGRKRLDLRSVEVVQDARTRIQSLWIALEKRADAEQASTLAKLLGWHAASDDPHTNWIAALVAIDAGDSSGFARASSILEQIEDPALLQSLWRRLPAERRRALDASQRGVVREAMKRARYGWGTAHPAVRYLPYEHACLPHFGGPPVEVDAGRVFAWLRERVWEIATPPERFLLDEFRRLDPEERARVYEARLEEDVRVADDNAEAAIESWCLANPDSLDSPPDGLGHVDDPEHGSLVYQWCRHSSGKSRASYGWGVGPWLAALLRRRGRDSDAFLRGFEAALIMSEVAPGLVRSIREVVDVGADPLRPRVLVQLHAGKGLLLVADEGTLGEWRTTFGPLDALRA